MTQDEPTTRAFLAVALPPALREALAAWVREVRHAPGSRAVRWVRAESLHLTLRFLGELPEARLAAVRVAAERVVALHAACETALLDVGPFPNGRRPRVVAARFAPVPELAALASGLEEAAVGCGLAPEVRRFHPHITLGRVRGRSTAGLPTAADLAVEPLPVDAVVLYRSELSASGARYTVLDRFALRAGS